MICSRRLLVRLRQPPRLKSGVGPTNGELVNTSKTSARP